MPDRSTAAAPRIAGTRLEKSTCCKAYRSAQQQQGFTLLELVVVILIIGVLVTLATLSVGNRVLEDKLQTEAERALAIIQLASEEAEAKGIDIGLRFSENGYRLLVVNNKKHWNDYEASGSLRRRELGGPVSLALRVEDRPVQLQPDPLPKVGEVAINDQDEDDKAVSAAAPASKQRTPQVLLLSSGEMTPFVLELTGPGLAVRYRLEGNALGKLNLTRLATGAKK